MKRYWAGDLMMLAATMIFGAMTIFSKQILAELEVYNMVALRFLIAFAVCFIVFRRRYASLDRSTAIHSWVIGTFLFVSYLCMVVGCKYTTASNAGFMMSLVAFFTPLIILVQDKVIPDGRQIASVIITLIGVGLMCLSGRLTLNYGDLICILSAFFYSFQMLYTERYAHQHDPIVLGTFQLFFVSIYGFIFAFLLEDSFRLPASPAGWGQLLYLALGCGALGFILQTSAEKLSPTSHTTLIYAAEPVFVALFSYMLLGEPISLRQIAGIIIVFIGVMITVRVRTAEPDAK
ncbi:MAG: DMT family transporter [Mogibacterium sp.]|nr:DMT family transporter [Mogibacterium sp.]